MRSVTFSAPVVDSNLCIWLISAISIVNGACFRLHCGSEGSGVLLARVLGYPPLVWVGT
jgi:hypothetical protein